MRIEVQAIGIRIFGAEMSADFESHAQFAVSQVADKAKHWLNRDSACDRSREKSIERTQGNTLDAYSQGRCPSDTR